MTQPLGDQDPYWAPPPGPRRARRSRVPGPRRSRILPGVTVAAIGIFGAGWYDGATWATRSHPDERRLSSAQQQCDPARKITRLTDEGRTLVINGRRPRDLTCLLDTLGTPEAVRRQMLATRPIDGLQRDGWAGFTASWSFDSAAGIEVIIHRKP